MENSRKTNMKLSNGRRVILFPLPLQSHISAMLQLANILYSKGFSITIIHTCFNSPNSSNYPHFTFEQIPDGLLESEASTEDAITLAAILNVKCVEPFRECLVKLLYGVKEEPISCLITDAVWHFAQAIADSLDLPRVVLSTVSVSFFVAIRILLLFEEKGCLPFNDSQLEESLSELPPLKVKDLPVIETSDPETPGQLMFHILNQIKGSSGLIWNTYEELEQVALTKFGQDFAIPIFPIGPFHKYFPAYSSSLLPQDQGSISWLDNQTPKSVLYVSFGSIVAISETEFLEIAWGLANSKQPFLWVVRPGFVRGSKWIELLPNGFMEMIERRGYIVKWAPQQEVLAHEAIGGFCTHNGWNSTLESICEGVPMICLPFAGDQLVNARFVSDVWRVGVHLERKLKRVEIERAIRRVMVEEEGKEMRERIMYFKNMVDLCLGQGGSSHQSLERLVCHMLSF